MMNRFRYVTDGPGSGAHPVSRALQVAPFPAQTANQHKYAVCECGCLGDREQQRNSSPLVVALKCLELIEKLPAMAQVNIHETGPVQCVNEGYRPTLDRVGRVGLCGCEGLALPRPPCSPFDPPGWGCSRDPILILERIRLPSAAGGALTVPAARLVEAGSPPKTTYASSESQSNFLASVSGALATASRSAGVTTSDVARVLGLNPGRGSVTTIGRALRRFGWHPRRAWNGGNGPRTRRYFPEGS